MRGLNQRQRSTAARRREQGMSLVELMVGVAVGLIVVAAASFVAVNQLGDNRRMLLETQLQQDLRATADLIARDLRRASYWGAAQAGVWYEGGPNVAGNPYSVIDPAADGALAHEVNYVYSREAENGVIDDDKERFGFKLENQTVKMLVGSGGWQELTDPNVLRITRFDVSLQNETVVHACFKECPGGGTACWPRQDVRRFTVEIAGTAVFDPAVQRSVRNSMRLRNDTTSGACPA